MDYKILKKPDYAGKLICKNYKLVIEFYIKIQMKRIYPNKNYRIVGEINNKTGVQNSIVEICDGNVLPIYKEKTHNLLTEKVVGFTAVDIHTYLSVVKNVLIQRICILFIIVVIFLLVYICIF